MNILLIDFVSFIQPDIIYSLKKMGIHFKNIYFHFPMGDEGKFENEDFERIMLTELKASKYDLVFSTNLLPVVGKVAYDHNLPYIAWSYDSPINLISRQYFDLPNTKVYLFDRMEAEKFRKEGYDNFFHLPLAVNCERLSVSKPRKDLKCEISFIGKLYNSSYPYLSASMSAHDKGYCDALIKAQLMTYGAFLIDGSLNSKLLDSINNSFNNSGSSLKDINISREQLSYSLASQVTHVERISLLNILSKKHDVHLYTGENLNEISELSETVKKHGPLSYIEDMPSLFKSSRINLCPTLKNIQSGIPLRALDILGSTSFLLSNWQSELAECFVYGKEIIMYESIEDAAAKAKYYLSHDAERESVIHAGFQKVSKDFRYEDRIKEILKGFDIS